MAAQKEFLRNSFSSAGVDKSTAGVVSRAFLLMLSSGGDGFVQPFFSLRKSCVSFFFHAIHLQEKCFIALVCIHKTHELIGTYDAARYSWNIHPAKAERAERVWDGRVKGRRSRSVRGRRMASASKVHFHEVPPTHASWHKQGKRFGFVGHSASKGIEQLYLGKGLPQVLRIQRRPDSIRQVLESVGSACVLFVGQCPDME